MSSGNRLFLALGLLVAVWIIVYWVWDPRGSEPPVTRGDAPPAAETGPRPGDGAERAATAEPTNPADPAVFTLPEPPRRPPQADRPAAERSETVLPPPEELTLPPIPGTEPALPESPAAPVVPPQGVIPPEFVEYTIQSGDTFERIAAREFGDRALGAVIARANPLKDPRRLQIGDVIRIPRDPANIQGIPAAGGPGGAGPTAPPTQAQAEYVVQPGDTLTGISQSFYGTTQHWELIYAANRGELSSPEALRVGQTLIIPPPPAR